jgi:hypothetical protein
MAERHGSINKGIVLTASHEELNEQENQRQDLLNFIGKPIPAEKLLWEIGCILNQIAIDDRHKGQPPALMCG